MRIEGKRQQQHEKEVAKQREHAQQVASDIATLHHQRTYQLTTRTFTQDGMCVLTLMAGGAGKGSRGRAAAAAAAA